MGLEGIQIRFYDFFVYEHGGAGKSSPFNYIIIENCIEGMKKKQQ